MQVDRPTPFVEQSRKLNSTQVQRLENRIRDNFAQFWSWVKCNWYKELQEEKHFL
jgi:hypothetical protein